MSKITKICLNCNKEFLTDTREINRGRGNYCSRSCSSFKELPLNKLVICKNCGKEFYAALNSAKYCSQSCKTKNYRLRKHTNKPYQSALEKAIQMYPCEICGWDESSRDVHHIHPVSKGGKSDILNIISLCPNHHRLADKELLSQDYLLEIVKFRTISSSLKLILDKIKELGAVDSP